MSYDRSRSEGEKGTVRVAAVAAPFGRDIDAAFTRVAGIIDHARRCGAAMVVLPECTLGGYLYDRAGEDPVDLPPALDPDGPEIARLIDLAGPTVVCAGYCEDAPGGPFNSAVCVSGDGVLGRHRKVHLPIRDRDAYAPGDRFEAFDTPLGRMGMMICYDKLFPEAARTLALDGAELVACLSAWPVNRADPASLQRGSRRFRQFDLFDQARAAENQLVWVSSNQTGTFGRLNFLGHAKIVDPEGTVLRRTGVRTGTAFADVNLHAMRARARFPLSHLDERLPEAYEGTPPAPRLSAVA